MDTKEVISLPLQVVIRFLQFLVLVLLIVNACTFINNFTNPNWSREKEVSISIQELSIHHREEEENITDLLRYSYQSY